MDILADLLQSVRLNPSVLTQKNLYGDWGMVFPCDKSAGFHIVTRGNCWVRSPRLKESILLQKGDILLVNQGTAHDLVSEPDTAAVSIEEHNRSLETMKNQEKGELSTSLICGVYHFGLKPLHPFFSELPEIYHIPSTQISSHHPIHSALMLLSAELDCSNDDNEPGNSLVIDRLVDVLFFYILRHWMKNQEKNPNSWAAAYSDVHLKQSLVVMHENYDYSWSVEELSRKAGLSRAAFSQKFKSAVGDSPINYLTGIRIQKAMEQLKTTSDNIENIAESVGYSSGFALSKAFKRFCGISPKSFRKQEAAI